MEQNLDSKVIDMFCKKAVLRAKDKLYVSKTDAYIDEVNMLQTNPHLADFTKTAYCPDKSTQHHPREILYQQVSPVDFNSNDLTQTLQTLTLIQSLLAQKAEGKMTSDVANRLDELMFMLSRIISAMSCDTNARGSHRDAASAQLAYLSARQRQVMEMVLAGNPSKNIAIDLGISQRTVENHRASIMKKTGSKSLPALARLAMAAA